MLDRKISERVLSKVTQCLTKRGSTYLHKMRTGLIDDCSIMNAWKIILIKYLLESHKKELDCLYNCANSDAPTTPQNTTSCINTWIAGGPVTGVNDQAFAGSSITAGEGTTVTNPSLFFVVSNDLFNGDVIVMSSGLVWKLTGTGCHGGNVCYNPETQQGVNSGIWTLCQPSSIFTPTTSAVNYLDNFINFVNKFCADCNTNF